MKKSKRPPMKKAQRVGSLIKDILGKPGFGEQLSRHQAWLIWDQIVGEQIATRARPLKLRKGVLEVQVDHPVWMQQLHMLKPKILEKINTRLPNAEITDIYLRQTKTLGDRVQFRPPKAPEPLPWEKIELSDEEIREINREFDSLQNGEIRNELRRLRMLQKRVEKTGKQD